MIFDFRRRNGPEMESSWLSGAVAAVIVVAVCATFIAAFVFAIPEDAERLRRIQIWQPFGVLAVAGITFLTVVWRGLISARQADTSIRQLEGLQRQIAMSEENNLASLLQKGAELISETSISKQSAGIVSLEAVASAEIRKYCEPARHLLADFVQLHGSHNHHDRVVQQTIEALNESFKKSRVSVRMLLRFGYEQNLDDEIVNWQMINGIQNIKYNGGRMTLKEICSSPGISRFRNVTFEGCKIENCDFKFALCTFNQC